MPSVKVGWFVLVLVVMSTGCDRVARKDVVQESQTDAVCLKRADVKLIAAALIRNTAAMETAINSGADVNATIDELGPSIVVTTLGDNYGGLQLLLDRGANINAEDSEGYTALKPHRCTIAQISCVYYFRKVRM